MHDLAPAAEPRHREQPSGEEFPPSHRPAASPAAGMCQLLLLLLALAALPCGTDGQLDASWTPSGDGPLPLSDNYRSTLRKLCRLLDKDKLPPKLASSHSTPWCSWLPSQLAASTSAQSNTWVSGSRPRPRQASPCC